MVKAHAISGRFYLGLNHSHDDEVGTSGIRQEGGAVVLMNCPGLLSKGEKMKFKTLCQIGVSTANILVWLVADVFFPAPTKMAANCFCLLFSDVLLLLPKGYDTKQKL